MAIIGFNGTGTAYQSSKLVTSAFVPPQDGSIDSIWVKLTQSGGVTRNYQVGVWIAKAESEYIGDNLKHSSASVEIAGNYDNWYEFPLPSPLNVYTTNSYWLAVEVDNATSVNFWYGTGTAWQTYIKSTISFPDWSDDLAGTTKQSNLRQQNIYATLDDLSSSSSSRSSSSSCRSSSSSSLSSSSSKSSSSSRSSSSSSRSSSSSSSRSSSSSSRSSSSSSSSLSSSSSSLSSSSSSSNSSSSSSSNSSSSSSSRSSSSSSSSSLSSSSSSKSSSSSSSSLSSSSSSSRSSSSSSRSSSSSSSSLSSSSSSSSSSSKSSSSSLSSSSSSCRSSSSSSLSSSSSSRSSSSRSSSSSSRSSSSSCRSSSSSSSCSSSSSSSSSCRSSSSSSCRSSSSSSCSSSSSSSSSCRSSSSSSSSSCRSSSSSSCSSSSSSSCRSSSSSKSSSSSSSSSSSNSSSSSSSCRSSSSSSNSSSSSSSCRSSSSSCRSSSSSSCRSSSSSSSSSFTPYIKEMFGRALVSKSAETNLYADSDVSQPVPVVPTGVLAVDMQKGDLIRLSWDDVGNYGYNVYRTAPGGRLKLNTYLIQDTSYLVGGLTEDTEYTFVVTGLNGVGTESADSDSVIETPTSIAFTDSRVRTYTYQVKINTVARSDVILESVDLGYGSSPATAKFTIPKDPITTVGLPAIDDDVEVIVNSTSIFKGIIKNRQDVVSSSSKSVSYLAYSKVVLQTYNPVTWDYILSIAKDYNGLNVTDQNQLQALETVANYLGNYRLYYNMQTDTVEQYKLGTGYWNRQITLGKNIIEYDVTENNLNTVTKVTIRGDRKRTRTAWQPFIMEVIPVTIPGMSTTNTYAKIISAFNISNIRVEGLVSLGQPTIEWNNDVAVVPSDFGLVAWTDNTVDQKKTITDYQNPPSLFRSAGTKIEYIYEKVGDKDIPTQAIVTATSASIIYKADTEVGNAYRPGREGHPEEDINFGWVRYGYPTKEMPGGYRYSYEYEEETPTEVSVGSGTPAVTITDTQYKIFVNNAPLPTETTTDNTTEVTTAMTERANGELEKLNRPSLGGRIRILGDETFDLKTLVTVKSTSLDVIRVSHNFVNGFTTEIELTNEKFRINVPPYQTMQKTVYDKNLVNQLLSSVDMLAIQLQQAKTTGYFEQDKNTITLTTPFALFSD